MSDPELRNAGSDRLQRLARRIAWVVGAGLLGVVITLVALRVLVARSSLPILDRAAWQAARERWSAAGVESYEIEIEVQGRQAATYAVQVRDGNVIEATRNGSPLPQQRTWHTWTVEGMFETIARDLESVERHATGRADAGTPRVEPRGVFEARYGFPERYLRTEMVRLGANPEVSWQVVHFAADAPDAE